MGLGLSWGSCGVAMVQAWVYVLGSGWVGLGMGQALQYLWIGVGVAMGLG